jgi:acetyl-CoA C-acetyltransferase
MQLAAQACRRALQDAGVNAIEVDTIAFIRLFSDAAKIWASPFGGSNNPPESVARQIGANPQRRIYSTVGGTEPLTLMAELLLAIARGEMQLALLTGAEAIATQRFATRKGYTLDWVEEFDAPLDKREFSKRYASREEVACGLILPAHFYALIENAQAQQLGHSPQQHREYMAQMLAPFSSVAASNPYAQSPVEYSAAQLAQISPDNYPIALPFTKRLIAQDSVNQSAALVLTNVENARRLGVDPRQWTFLTGYADAVDQYLAQREDPARSTAMRMALETALDRAQAATSDMELIDFYSCFPCAVHAACDILNLPVDGSIPLTVTGGLPFFGGPGNNYSLHALAEIAARLRGHSSRALVTANGGMLSKHAAAVLSAEPALAGRIDWQHTNNFTLDGSSIAARPLAADPADGAVLSYTVIARKNAPDSGIVLAETNVGERFVAASDDAAITASMQHQSPIGRRIAVTTTASRHEFYFASG